MVRRGAAKLPSDPEAARLHLLGVAETCFERYGLGRTTMEDIAVEAKVSRPTLYRYFGDRDALVRTIAGRRAVQFMGRAHEVLSGYETLEEQLVEGMIFLARIGHRDQFFSALLSHETLAEAHQIIMSRSSGSNFSAGVWGPVFDAAAERGELREGIDRPLAYRWLTSVNIILIGDLDPDGDGTADQGQEQEQRHRDMLRAFVAPAFCAASTLGRSALGRLTKNKKR